MAVIPNVPKPVMPAPSPSQLEREKRALELRRDGYSFDDIAHELSLADRSQAFMYFRHALARPVYEDAHEVRQVEAIRLDRLQLAVWDAAIAGDLAAVASVLKISERRARLLGLDHSDGIAERQLALEEGKIRLIAAALDKVFDSLELDGEQRREGTRVLLDNLRSHAAEQGDAT